MWVIGAGGKCKKCKISRPVYRSASREKYKRYKVRVARCK